MSALPVYTRTRQKFSGRLLALPSNPNLLRDYDQAAGTAFSGSDTQLVSIEFPAMPDDFQLDRRTSYLSQASMMLPDGMHLYQYTSPLEIPFRFKLFGDDPEYCEKDGPATLLALASRLHFFTLPINKSPQATHFTVRHLHETERTESAEKALGEQPLTPEAEQKPLTLFSRNQREIRPPATCILELIRISDQSDRMGIHGRGYVRDVTVRFIGPWLRGRGKQFNVPTAAEYGFTFVHVPSHNNDYSMLRGEVPVTHAYAHDVVHRLYNTVSLNNVLAAQGYDLASPAVTQPTAAAVSAETPAEAPAPPSFLEEMIFGAPIEGPR